jgi:hypothetical protein
MVAKRNYMMERVDVDNIVCDVVDTGVALCGRSVEVPSEEKSRMIALTMRWRWKVLPSWRVQRDRSFQ